MTWRAFFLWACVVAAALAYASPAWAHGTRSASIDVVETTSGKAAVHVRTTFPDDKVVAEFSAPCATAPGDEEGDSVTLVDCPESIAGATITARGLGPLVTEAILIVSLSDGTRVSHVLTADDPSFTLPVRQTGLALARSYVRLGAVHIATGYDHLLFLMALVLLLRRPRAVIAAESAFTVSHSLSFSATALGWVHVSQPAAEACIALSLVLLALDIGRKGADTSTKRGASMAFVFGFVHGLGFAGGLAEIGLPDHDVALALLGFAGGVEIGQIVFLALMLAVVYGAVSLANRFSWKTAARLAEPVLVRAIGGVSSYWLIERTLASLSR